MHAIQPDPRVLLAALVALLLAIVAALAAAPSLSDLELGGGGAAPVKSETPVKQPVPPPAWASDPLAPPALLR